MNSLKWSDFAGTDPFHVVRIELPSPMHVPTHTHSNYAELFLVEAGGLTHRINNIRKQLCAGTLVLIRPGDTHHLRMQESGTVYSNIAMPIELIDEFQARYLNKDTLLWNLAANSPAEFVLDNDPLTRIIQLIDQLSRSPRNRLEADRFLLNLYHELSTLQAPVTDHNLLPDWLARACREIHQPQHLREGISAFARLASRSPEHTSRVLKKYTGKTPSQIVNEARLQEAARLLCMSSKEIIDIAADCGFENLGYFYRLFKQRYGLSPRRHRIANHAVAAFH